MNMPVRFFKGQSVLGCGCFVFLTIPIAIGRKRGKVSVNHFSFPLALFVNFFQRIIHQASFSIFSFLQPLCKICFAFLIFLSSCTDKFTPPVLNASFDENNLPPAPDYSKATSWCALPDKKDLADVVPGKSQLKDGQETAIADVFFIHPTSYLKNTEVSSGWNADVADETINQKTDYGAIKYQASVFNGVCRVYSPRYRQAFISVYYQKDKSIKENALAVGYSDVKKAFEYYLTNYNNGRPIVIASHSQGTTHAINLMKDFFEGKDLQQQLVAAYMIGMDVYDTCYTSLKPCTQANETGCYISWRTYAANYFPPNYQKPNRYAINTNPLTWTTDSTYAPVNFNKGGILKKFEVIIPGLCDAQIGDGVLRINKPNFRGSRFFNFKNYHIVDYNLFYLNIRENVKNRVKMFLDKK